MHQLRAPPADFVGRREELEDLRARLGAGGAIIAGLTGQGGVGKTALALVLAHELRERYPDAQIDIDLKGASAEPLAPRQVMAEVIRAFEPEAKLPESMDALGRVYRSMLDCRRVLLLFDNARDRAQVEPLIPPRGCLMLVTSRQHFTLPGIHTRRLGLLAPDQAVSLVRDVAPRLDEATAGELAKLCGYLPLALRVAARALAEKVTLKPGMYIERLRSAQERLDEVDAVLREGLALLEAPTRDLWLHLGVFQGDFDQEAASAVSGVGGAADMLLGELVRWNLLEWEEQTERYRLHDLARDYARSCLQAEEQLLAERQHADHFLNIATAANDLFKNGTSITDALARIDLEWGNIVATQAWIAAHAASDDTAARVCCDLPVGTAWAAIGDMHRAVNYFEQSLTVARQIGNRHGEATVLGNLGVAYLSLREVYRSIVHCEQHLAITRELGDRSGEVRALGNLGIAYADIEDVRQAIGYYEQAMSIAREIGDGRSEALISWNLGIAHEKLGDRSRAIELMQARVDFERALDHPDADKHQAGVDQLRARLQT